MNIEKDKYNRLETRDADGKLIANTYFKPQSEDTIELHHEVFSFGPHTYRELLLIWDNLCSKFYRDGYTRVVTASEDIGQADKTKRYWKMFGFSDFKLIEYKGKTFLLGVAYLKGVM